MVAVLLIAGIGFLLAGFLAIVFGIPVQEFSFGNTLILSGAIATCTGAIMLGLWTVVRELKNIARRLGPGVAESHTETALHSAAAGATARSQAPEGGGFLFSRDQSALDNAGNAAGPSPAAPPPWHEEAASRDRVRDAAPAMPEPVATPAAKQRRNLLFTSSRKERERAQARASDPSAADIHPVPRASETSGAPATFEDAWPQTERPRAADAAPRRSGRAPSTSTEPNKAATTTDRSPPAAQDEDQPPVTVLKSGVVDGMAYSLYSDGSIEAQMPEGMMRFASIDALRAHLDQRS
jgi:hypothetical protein